MPGSESAAKVMRSSSLSSTAFASEEARCRTVENGIRLQSVRAQEVPPDATIRESGPGSERSNKISPLRIVRRSFDSKTCRDFNAANKGFGGRAI